MCNEKNKTAQQDKSQGRSKFKRFATSPFNALAQILVDYAQFGIMCHSLRAPMSCCAVHSIFSFIAADGLSVCLLSIKVPHLRNMKEQALLYIVEARGHKIESALN